MRPTSQRPVHSTTRLVGVETEFGFALLAPDGERIDSSLAAAALMREVRALLTGAEPLSLTLCHCCVTALGSLIPSVPVPVLPPGLARTRRVLENVYAAAARHDDAHLVDRAGTLLYRFHEARGAYCDAAHVIEDLIARTSEQRNRHGVALLTNNLGYEHLLSGDWASAEPLFERAIALFERAGESWEAASVRANLLECRFHRTPAERRLALAPAIRRLNRTLVGHRDWRARKTQMLLARLAAQRARRGAAIGWARRALRTSERIPTQLRDQDRVFLEAIRTRAEAG